MDLNSQSFGSLSRRDVLRAGGIAAVAGMVPGLAGCAGGGTIGGSGEGANLQFMYWGSSLEKAAIQQMMKRFTEEHEGVSVQPIHVPGDYVTKVNTLVASDELPDVAYMLAPIAYRLATQGKVQNIYKYIDKYPQLSDRSPADFYWWGDNKIVGTPGANEITLLWYDKDKLAEANVDSPPAVANEAWSWDDLVETADKLTVDQDGRHPSESGFKSSSVRQFGISAPMSTRWTWYPLMLSNGADITDESGTKYLLNSPESVEVFQNLQDLIYEHRVAPSPAQLGAMGGAEAPTTTVQLQTGRIAMAIDGQWILLDLGKTDLNYGLGVLPSYQEPMTIRAGSPRILSANTKHPEEAVELYVYSVDGSNSDLFGQGLWMPVERKYYEDEESINSWIKNDVHPPEYRTAAVDYLLNNSVPDYQVALKNTLDIEEVLLPALQRIESGKVPARQALDDLQEKMEPLLQGWWPTPSQL